MKKLKDLLSKQSANQPFDLGTATGVTKLTLKTAPDDYVMRVQSTQFRVKGYYKLDNVKRWLKWENIVNMVGGQERWLFFSCPATMIESILSDQMLRSYDDVGEFGRNAIPLYQNADRAAKHAFQRSNGDSAYLISCRLAFHNPHDSLPLPKGHDTLHLTRRSHPDGELFVTHERDTTLLRFITHIERS